MDNSIIRPLRHEFSEEELNEMRDNIADLVGEQTQVELEKKEVNKDFKTKLDDIKSRIKVLGLHLREKFSTHDVLCKVEYNQPEKNYMILTRTDTNEQWTEEMSANDWNLFNQPEKSEEE